MSGRCRAEFSEGDLRALAHRPVVDQAGAPDLAPEKQVLGDGQVLGEKDLLVDEHDAPCARPRPGPRTRPAHRRKTGRPCVGGRWPERMRMSVDLPAPFSPITAWTSPASSASDTSLRTSMGPKDFETRSARSTAMESSGSRAASDLPTEGGGGGRRRDRARPAVRRSGRGISSRLLLNGPALFAERTGPPVSLDGRRM